MKKSFYLFLLLSVFAFYGCNDNDDNDDNDKRTYVLSLPTYAAETLYLGNLENPDSKWDDPEYGSSFTKNLLLDKSKIFGFDCRAVRYAGTTEYGINSDSFAFTNCTSGDYSAVTTKGVNNATYVIVGASGYEDGVAISFKDDDNTKEIEDYRIKGLFVTNSVYAYNSMKNGSDFAQGADKFGKDDSLILTIYNFNKTKSVDVYLAQGTDLLNTWKWVDLTSLGETVGLKFTMTTTKVNSYGAITPTYFCLDGITLIED